MAPGNGGITGTRSGRRGAYQYTAIDDFRPGLITDKRSRTFSEGRFPLPRGAAKTAINCIATPSGQLTALTTIPGLASPTSGIGNVVYNTGSVSVPYTVGFICIGGYRFIGLQGDNGGAGPNYQQKAHLIALAASNNVVNGSSTRISTNTYPTADQLGMLHGMSFAFGRARASTFQRAGNPTLFAEWAEFGAANKGGAALTRWVSPDPTNTANMFLQTNTTVNQPTNTQQILISHNARILALNNIAYGWGPFLDRYLSNEAISYTDPPGNYIFTAADTILDPVEPKGYGSWGALSYGELILFKHQGGALQVIGDIYAPTVVRMPGVRSTHGLYSPAVQTARGLIYLVNYDGAYIWTGGLSSQKVSTVPDRFYLPFVTMAQGVDVTPARWGNYVVYPGGWVYDDITGSWWRLDQTMVGESATGAGDGGISFACAVGQPDDADGLSLAALPAQMTDTSHLKIYSYSGTGGGRFTWQSQPLMLLPERQVTIREVIIDIQAMHNFQVQIWISDIRDVNILVFDEFISGAGMQRIRMPCGVTSLNPSVMITCTPGAGPGPGGGSTFAKGLLSQIVLGWEESEPISQTVP